MYEYDTINGIGVTVSKHGAHFSGAATTSDSTHDKTQILPNTNDKEQAVPMVPAVLPATSQVGAVAGAAGAAGAGVSDTNTPKAAAHPHTAKKLVMRSVAAVIALLAIGYCAGGWYFSHHFMRGTSYLSYDVSYMDEHQFAAKLAQIEQDYTFLATYADFSSQIHASDIAYKLSGDTNAKQAIHDYAPGFSWLAKLLQNTNITLATPAQFDKDALNSVVAQQIDEYNKNATNPVDAYAQFDDASQTFIISDAKVGSAIEPARASEEIATAIETNQTSVAMSDTVLKQPTLSSDNPDLIAIADRANKALNLTISLRYQQKELARVGKNELKSWMHIANLHELSVDQSAIETWGKDNLIPKLKTDDPTRKPKVLYDKLAAALTKAVNNGAADPITLPVSIVRSTPATAPAESEGAKTRGRHVDVNIANQYARLYDEDGDVLWQSYIVSGKNGATPTGTFYVNALMRNQTLIGLDTNNDGQPDYKSHVSYWMPFVGNMVGMHDAPWRSVFGGKVYQSSGSHGCVNLPPSKAADLYGLLKVGDVVYVH